MPEEKKKKKKKKASDKKIVGLEKSVEQLRLLELLPQLKELEKQCRSRFQTISGYQINRSTSESTTLTDLLRELEALECEVASLLDGFQQADIADIAVPIAQLLDAGSHDFFSGSRRGQGKLVMSAARRALCGRKGGGAGDDEGEEGDDDVSVSDAQSDVMATSPKDEEGAPLAAPKEQRESAADQLRVENLIAAFASAGYLALCMQLWRPARDGDHATLARLLELAPWTVDEPGRQGQGCTNALQVACAAGHVECVDLLLRAGAVFRDADWQQPTPHPFVCSSMLTGAGYFDDRGAPRGILYFQPSSFPKRRIARATYVHICDMLLERAAFCEGQADREVSTSGAAAQDAASRPRLILPCSFVPCTAESPWRLVSRQMVVNTRFAMLSVEPPPLPPGVIACPPYVPPPKPIPAPAADAPGQHTARARGVSAATPRGGVASATPRNGTTGGVSAATPRSGSAGGLGRGMSPVRSTTGASRVGGATPRDGLSRAMSGGVGGRTPRDSVGRATPRGGTTVGGRTPRMGALPRFDC